MEDFKIVRLQYHRFFSFSLKKENSRRATYRWKANMKWKRTNKSVHLYLHGHAVEISWHWRSRGGSVSNGVGACFSEMNFRCGYAQTPRCYLQKNDLYVRETQSQAQKLNLQDALCEAYIKALWSLYQSTSFILMPTWSFLPWRTAFKEILWQIFKNR